jgi:alpha-amylase
MSAICFYFQIHQPNRVKRYRHFDIGHNSSYFDDKSDSDVNNERILHKVASKSYLPTNQVFLDLLNNIPELKISYSISGVTLDQFERYSPETLESFKRLVDTGRVEMLGETYHHSLSFFYSVPEFERQVRMHRKRVEELFGVTPTVFRNTELAYTNELGQWAEAQGYDGVITEGWEHYLGWRSPNYLYTPKGASKIKLLLKNYRLSDDVAFRFSEQSWRDWPLTAEKFAQWVNAINGAGDTVNLFMDYETFGEHQWEDTGIFDFLRALPHELLKHPDNEFLTPSEVVAKYPSRDELDVPHILTWADTERDLSAWRGNDMQHSALNRIYALEDKVLKSSDEDLVNDWRRLQTSDHFYYMCTKWFNDGDVHAYFSPYESPYDAYRYYMNVLQDLELRLQDIG